MRATPPLLVLLVLAGCGERPAPPPSVPPPPPPAAEVAKLEALKPTYVTGRYCFAQSRIKDEKAFGGFGPCDNPTWLAPAGLKSHAPAVFLHLAVDQPIPFYAKYRGISLYLVNMTNARAAFEACDSRLAITQEAQGVDGRWRPLERAPIAICGNSFHRVFLDPGECWRFAVPRYDEGDFPTKLRFALTGQPGGTIYSNEIDGRIRRTQFDEAPGTPTPAE